MGKKFVRSSHWRAELARISNTSHRCEGLRAVVVAGSEPVVAESESVSSSVGVNRAEPWELPKF
jgi:hypothetical protein